MADFTWIEQLEPESWGDNPGCRRPIKISFAEFSERSQCHPNDVVPELQAWLFEQHRINNAAVWSSDRDASDVLLLTRLS